MAGVQLHPRNPFHLSSRRYGWFYLSSLVLKSSGMFQPSCSHFCVRHASFYRLSRIKARISWKFHQVKGMDPVRLARCYLFILATWLGACCPTQHHQKRCFPEALNLYNPSYKRDGDLWRERESASIHLMKRVSGGTRPKKKLPSHIESLPSYGSRSSLSATSSAMPARRRAAGHRRCQLVADA